MIKLYEEQKMCLSQMQRELGISHYTLYRYANKEIPIDRMEIGMFMSLCKLVKEEPKTLYKKMKQYLEK